MPKHKNHLPQHEVRRLFDYREDGLLINRFTRSPRAVKGGVAGSLTKSTGYWRARIRDHSKQVHLGLYDTPEQASAAYWEYANNLHGEYKC